MKISKLVLSLLAIAAASPAMAEEYGKWTRDRAHGYERYWTQNNSGARFAIWCPPNHNKRAALIGIDIEGALPEPDSLVRVELDHKLIKFRVGPDGYIRNDCPACADNLTYFWHRMRSAVKLIVLFEDKRYAGFSLKGVKDATPHSVCSSQLARNGQ